MMKMGGEDGLHYEFQNIMGYVFDYLGPIKLFLN